MTRIVPYFQVHQPYRLRHFGYFDAGSDAAWFDDDENRRIVQRVAERCYLPTTQILRELVEETEGAFRCSFSFSGTVLEQLEEWAPDALDAFIELANTGAVEVLCETSHHSMGFHSDVAEWRAQVELQRARILDLFGSEPTTFRNTELVIDEAIAREVEGLGFRALLGEGADGLLLGRTAHRPWRPRGCKSLQLLLRDYPFSDDIAFRFSNRDWEAWPLFADVYASWLHALPSETPFVGLFMDYETFGEHQWAETGILDFLRYLPGYLLAEPSCSFATPAEVAAELESAGELAIPRPYSWADEERDLSAWLGNPMQDAAQAALYALLPKVRAAAEAGRPELLQDWRKLSTSDHVYYMCTKHLSDQDVHEYFSPYDSPHDAFLSFMNVLDDLAREIDSPDPLPIPLPTVPPKGAD